MNSLKLYQDLLSLCENTDGAFYYTDQTLDDKCYRIFNYRLASYSNFLLPNALECRGTMFDISSDTPRIVCRPMKKFFNYGEVPTDTGTLYAGLRVVGLLSDNVAENRKYDGLTEDEIHGLFDHIGPYDFTYDNLQSIQFKEDGSLISTFMHNGTLRVKSKGSLFSDQSLASSDIIHRDSSLMSLLYSITSMGYTVNMEYVAPTNRIVLWYDTPSLRILNVRDNSTGKVYSGKDLLLLFPRLGLERYAVEDVTDKVKAEYSTLTDFIEATNQMEGIEGYIVHLQDVTVKLKTEWYLTQHRAKDDVTNPRRLFECVIEESSDDLKTLFTDNDIILGMITEMESFASGIYNSMVNSVESFVNENVHLLTPNTTKDFALKAKSRFSEDLRLFNLAMAHYHKEVRGIDRLDYKAVCIKYSRDYLKDFRSKYDLSVDE